MSFGQFLQPEVQAPARLERLTGQSYENKVDSSEKHLICNFDFKLPAELQMAAVLSSGVIYGFFISDISLGVACGIGSAGDPPV